MEINVNKTKEYDEEDFIFFFSHKASKSKEVTDTCLSQWYKCCFYEDKILFTSAEQYMMYKKAILFEDYEIAYCILESENPKDIKAYGRKVKNFKDEIWIKNREKIVLQANLLKFSQNLKLKEYLINTKNKILLEASPYDKIWGIGMKKESEGITNMKNWKGKNLLGFKLMSVRDRLM